MWRGESQGQEEVSGTVKGRFCFVLCWVLSSVQPRERRTAVGTNCSSLRKVFISTCHTWLPDVPKKGWEEGGRGMWRMGYILKPNNLSFVFRSIVLGRGRMGRGRNPGCFLMQPVPISWMAFLVLQPPPREEKTPQSWPSREGFIYLFILRLSVKYYSTEPSWKYLGN